MKQKKPIGPSDIRIRPWLLCVQALFALAVVFTGLLHLPDSCHADDRHRLAMIEKKIEVLFNENKFSEAVAPAAEALSMKEMLYGKDDVQVGDSLNTLGLAYYKSGRLQEAEECFQRSYEIRSRKLGGSHQDTATSLNNLATVEKALKKHPDAEKHYTQAIDGWEAALGKEHLSVAIGLNGLAMLYYETKRYGEAEPLFKRALDIRRKSLGDDHPDVGMIMHNLAMLYKITGRDEEAAVMYRNARQALVKP